MKRKLTILILSMMPLVANAAPETIMPMSIPREGVSVTPLASMAIPEKMKQEIIERKNEEKVKGYVENDSDYARYLLSIPKSAPSELKAFKGTNNNADTHLKASINDIKLAFQFSPLNDIKESDIIGYAPVGTFINGEDKKYQAGWTGINILFKNKQIGICSYSLFNLEASHGAAQLNNETTEYLINKKPSSRTIEGSNQSGYLYYLNWFEPGKMSQMSCANKVFDKSIMQSMIMLAGMIDKQTD